MELTDLLRFYLGDGAAIRAVAADPWTPAVGAVLVLSAGLARNYDAHDLRRQWWRLLLPFAASTLAASLLFVVLVLLSRANLDVAPVGWQLLGLFWLTAPFAWLYGLPFERLWPAEQAARARRRALAVVAVCRVALMDRCVSELLGYGWGASLLIVASFAAPMALLAVAFALGLLGPPELVQVWAPRPKLEPAPPGGPSVTEAAEEVIDVMGGVPHRLRPLPEHPRVQPPAGLPKLAPLGNPPATFGCLAVTLLGLSSCLLPYLIGPSLQQPPALSANAAPPTIAVWAAAALAVLFWVPGLLRYQPAHRRRTEFVQRLCEGDLRTTLQDLADRRPEDFPPQWDPAVALAQVTLAPRALAAARIAAELHADCWVRGRILAGFAQMLPLWLDPVELWFDKQDQMPADQLQELQSVGELLRRLPEAAVLLKPYCGYLADLCGYMQKHDPPRSEVMEDLLVLALKRGSPR
jgi:hypothetical protein